MGNNQGSRETSATRKPATESQLPIVGVVEDAIKSSLTTPAANKEAVDVIKSDLSAKVNYSGGHSLQKSGLELPDGSTPENYPVGNPENLTKTSNLEDKKGHRERAEYKQLMNSLAFCSTLLREDLEKNSNFMTEFTEHDLMVEKVTSQPNAKNTLLSNIDPGEAMNPQVSLGQLKTDSLLVSTGFDGIRGKEGNPFGTFSADVKIMKEKMEMASRFSVPVAGLIKPELNQQSTETPPAFGKLAPSPRSELSMKTSNFGANESNARLYQSNMLAPPIASMKAKPKDQEPSVGSDQKPGRAAVGQPFLKRSSNKQSEAQLPPAQAHLNIPHQSQHHFESSMNSGRLMDESLRYLSVPHNEIGPSNAGGTHGKRNFMESDAKSERSVQDVKMTDHYLDHMPVIKIDVHKFFREKSPYNEKLKRFVHIEQPKCSEMLFKQLKGKKVKKIISPKHVSPLKTRPYSRYEVETCLSSARGQIKYENPLLADGKWAMPRLTSVKKSHHSTTISVNKKADYDKISKELKDRETNVATQRFEAMFGTYTSTRKTPEKKLNKQYKEITHINHTPDISYLTDRKGPADDNTMVIDLRCSKSKTRKSRPATTMIHEHLTPIRNEYRGSHLTDTPNSRRFKVDIEKLSQDVISNVYYPRQAQAN